MPGPWNSTIVKGMTPANAPARIAAMRAAGMRNFFMPQGPVGLYRVNGVFSINLYVQSVRRWKPPSSGRSAVLDAIADETIAWDYLKDEPRHPSRWGPGGISHADMCTATAVKREVFPDLRVAGRFAPGPNGNAPGYGKVIPGLTAFWVTIKANRLPVASEVQRHLAEATALGAGLGCSINRRDFNDRGPAENSSNNPDGWITPAQMRLYGAQLAAFPQLMFMYGWWWAHPQWYTTVADMPAAELYVRGKFIETHS